MSVGSIAAFGITAIAHALLIAGVVMTVGTFEMASENTHFDSMELARVVIKISFDF